MFHIIYVSSNNRYKNIFREIVNRCFRRKKYRYDNLY